MNPMKVYLVRLRTALPVIFALLSLLCGYGFTRIPLTTSVALPQEAANALFAAGTATANYALPRIHADARHLLQLAFPYLSVSDAVPPAATEPPSEAADTPPSEAKTYTTAAENGYTAVDGIYLTNDTDATIDLTQLLTRELPFLHQSGDEPLILITHTHTSESYTPTAQYNYTPSDTDRTGDTDFNVARVGSELTAILKERGIGVLHDTTINDYPSYSGSYSKAAGITKSYLKQYPSIKIVLDLHRDAIIRSDGTRVKAVCDTEYGKTAQIMFVVGTNQSGLAHPNWQDNLAFAVRLQAEMNKRYPSLARPINLRKQRFNEQLAPGALIVEVGTSGNTLEEALCGIRCFADALSALLQN